MIVLKKTPETAILKQIFFSFQVNTRWKPNRSDNDTLAYVWMIFPGLSLRENGVVPKITLRQKKQLELKLSIPTTKAPSNFRNQENERRTEK